MALGPCGTVTYMRHAIAEANNNARPRLELGCVSLFLILYTHYRALQFLRGDWCPNLHYSVAIARNPKTGVEIVV